MKNILAFFVFIILAGVLFGYEMNTLIDSPTAGILQRGEAEISAKLYKRNGLILGTQIGLFPRFMFGVNYGAENIVGNQRPEWHDRVEFSAKFRILDETNSLPAIALGYDSQGHGNYHSDAERYDIKSKGFYGVMSKNYYFLGNLGFHLGANYSLERNDNDEDLNIYAGFDKSLGDAVVFLCEYDLAWNDNEDWENNTLDETVKGMGYGYLNASLDIYFTEYLILKISLYDLLENRQDTEGSDRTLSLLYYMTF
ncbi:MAG: hypothetical protein APR54_00135 [Candidatus Cloacimonas sp. SDB]|nr:MAG: hypothetical protein APR54_00135 [Candidatus Cloacimonas sp. SDB]